MTPESCSTCRYWFRIKDDAGSCRRYPPTLVPIVYTCGDDGRIATEFDSRLVDVTALDWCGEYQPQGRTPDPLPANPTVLEAAKHAIQSSETPPHIADIFLHCKNVGANIGTQAALAAMMSRASDTFKCAKPRGRWMLVS